MLCFRSFPQEGDKSHDITDRTFDRTSLVRCSVILGQEKCLEQFTIRYWMLQLKICIAKTHLVQTPNTKVLLRIRMISVHLSNLKMDQNCNLARDYRFRKEIEYIFLRN